MLVLLSCLSVYYWRYAHYTSSSPGNYCWSKSTDAVCPLCQEDEETVLHSLRKCSAFSAKHLSIPGYPYLSYEELWSYAPVCSFEVCKSLTAISTLLGNVGLRIRPTECLSVDGNISPQRRKKERKYFCQQQKAVGVSNRRVLFSCIALLLFVMAALPSRCGHYIFVLFLSSSFFLA